MRQLIRFDWSDAGLTGEFTHTYGLGVYGHSEPWTHTVMGIGDTIADAVADALKQLHEGLTSASEKGKPPAVRSEDDAERICDALEAFCPLQDTADDTRVADAEREAFAEWLKDAHPDATPDTATAAMRCAFYDQDDQPVQHVVGLLVYLEGFDA